MEMILRLIFFGKIHKRHEYTVKIQFKVQSVANQCEFKPSKNECDAFLRPFR